MKKHEVKLGGQYLAKVSGKVVVVHIDGENPHGGWDATNVQTKKKVRIKSAQRLRSAVRDHAKETADVLNHGREAAEAKAGTAKTPKGDAPAADGATTLAHGPRSEAAAAKGTKAEKKAARATERAAKAEKKAQAKAEKAANRKPGLLTLAAAVLKDAAAPMACKTIVEKVLAKGVWQTKGKTPAATLYSAILRETRKGQASRFRKVERGKFEIVTK